MADNTSAGADPQGEIFEFRYNDLKKEFKDYIENTRKNEVLKKKEIQSEQAKKLLVIADSLRRMASSVENETCDLVKGVHETYRQNIEAMYQQLLSSSGLFPINPSAGSKFDDANHIAIGLEYGSRFPENTIHSVIRSGYFQANILIRPAEVIISKHPRTEIPLKKPGIIQSIFQRFSSSGVTEESVSRQIDQLEHARSEDTQRLEQEIQSLQDKLVHHEEERKELEDMIVDQAESIESLESELDQIKRTLSETSESTTHIVSILHEFNERLQNIEDKVSTKAPGDSMYSDEEVI